jgi:hypothetical protein
MQNGPKRFRTPSSMSLPARLVKLRRSIHWRILDSGVSSQTFGCRASRHPVGGFGDTHPTML